MSDPVLNATAFLTAGGRISYAEWAALSQEQQDDLEAAGREVMARQAQEFVQQFRDLLGEMEEDARLEAMAANAEEALPK